MPRAHVIFTGIAAALLAAALDSANAQAPPAMSTPAGKLAQEEPYKPVAVKIAPAPDDPNFAAFRAQLAKVAKDRIYAELVSLVAARGFFWDGDLSGGFDPQRSPAENLAAAIRLESGGGGGWNALAGFAALTSATPLPSRPGVICAPARPQYDLVDFDQLVAATGTDAAVWRYPREEGMALRAGPRPTARIIETLGPYFVRLLDVGPLPEDWVAVAAPSGRTGYAAAAMLLPLHGDRLCYRKDATGRWHIAGS
ncbi:MAG: hypothetical protein WEC82_00295, partial [Xanthobacteraceae bacterium]